MPCGDDAATRRRTPRKTYYPRGSTSPRGNLHSYYSILISFEVLLAWRSLVFKAVRGIVPVQKGVLARSRQPALQLVPLAYNAVNCRYAVSCRSYCEIKTVSTNSNLCTLNCTLDFTCLFLRLLLKVLCLSSVSTSHSKECWDFLLSAPESARGNSSYHFHSCNLLWVDFGISISTGGRTQLSAQINKPWPAFAATCIS